MQIGQFLFFSMKIHFSIWIASRVYDGVAINVMIKYPSILTLICNVHAKGHIQPFWFKQGVASIMFLRMRVFCNLSPKLYSQLYLILSYQILYIFLFTYKIFTQVGIITFMNIFLTCSLIYLIWYPKQIFKVV